MLPSPRMNGATANGHYDDNDGLLRDMSTNTLMNREQQLRDEIARLRREEQELREKDLWIKQNIVAVRGKMMMVSDRR